MNVITTDLVTYNYAQLENSLTRAVKIPGRTVLVWGGPGVGKTACARFVAEKLDCGLVEVNCGRLAIHTVGGIGFTSDVGEDGVDGSGIKATDRDVKMSRPVFIKELWAVHDSGKQPFLLLDELPNNAKDVVSSLNEIMLEGRVGEHKLPPNTVVVGTGNRPEDNAVSCVMYGTTANRVSHCIYEGASVKEFVDWGTATGRLTPAQCAYLEANSHHLTDNEKGRVNNASHRSWEKVSKLLNYHFNEAPMGLGDLIQAMNEDLPSNIATGLGIYITMQGTLTPVAEVIADPDTALLPSQRDLDSGQQAVAEIMQLRMCKGALDGDVDKGDAKQVGTYVKRFNPELRAAFMSMVLEGQRMKTIKVGTTTVMQKLFAKEYMAAIKEALPNA